jgi:hypothetical protein
VKASKECESAERDYYMATEDESQLWFPPIPREQWDTFQKSVEKHFGKIARDLNSELIKILPWIYGFATARAVKILEAVENICNNKRKNCRREFKRRLLRGIKRRQI